MDFSIKKAFKSGFSDEKWYYKWIFPFIVIMVISLMHPHAYGLSNKILLVIGLLCLIPWIILNGFYMQMVHNEINDELPLLPLLKDNLKKYLKTGFFVTVILTIYTIAVGLLYLLLMLIFHKILVLFWIAFAIITIAFMFFIYIAQGAFADNFNFKNAFRLPTIWKLIINVKKEIVIFTVLIVIFSFIAGAFSSIALKIPAVLIISTFISVFVQMTTLNMVGQIYKIAKSRVTIPETVE